MRVGLFGGSFNPVHKGHLKAAREVREAFALDRILLIPSALPPHKDNQHIAAVAHRLAMLRLATEGMDGMDVCDIEAKRTGPSYTIDTIRYFQTRNAARNTDGTAYWLIMGMDAFLELKSWKDVTGLLSNIPLIIMNRPMDDNHRIDDASAFQRIARYLQDIGNGAYTAQADGNSFSHPLWPSIHLAHVTPRPVSATQIRARLRAGQSVTHLAPPAVADYIDQKGLYR